MVSERIDSAVFGQPCLPKQTADQPHRAAACNQAIATEKEAEIHLHEPPSHPLVGGTLPDELGVDVVSSADGPDMIPPPSAA